ncbi:DEAD/DEAH box helicase [Paenibacillus oryzisoli]|uniref:DEAD/DEAH box helicase n=1 Tax=Paenibacillus oryzisoli TaxID=1850517 RepID=UPI003D2B5B33
MIQIAFHTRVMQLSDGSFAIYGETEQANSVPESMLRKGLFAWHERSFYGTRLEVGTADYHPAVILSPLMAVDYLAAPAVLLHSKITWDEQSLKLQKGAGLLQQALASGWYVPSYEHWLEGKNGWKLRLPEDEQGIFAKISAGAFPESFWQAWFSAALSELLSSEASSLAEHWASLRRTYALLRVDDPDFERIKQECAWMQEEDWLQAIGLSSRDALPYQISVQLVEPYAETYLDGTTLERDNAADWRLRYIVQDRTDAGRIVEFTAGGKLLTGQLPPAWQEDIYDRLHAQTQRIVRMIPELESGFQPGKLLEELSDEGAWLFLSEWSLRLVTAGVSVYLPHWWEDVKRTIRPQLKAKLRNSVGQSRKTMFGLDQLMQFDWRIAIGGAELSEEEFQQLTEQKKRLIYLRGRWVQLDPAMLEEIRVAMQQIEKKKGLSFRDVLELHLSRTEEDDAAAEVKGVRDDAVQVQVELNQHLRGLMKQLQHKKTIPLQSEIPDLHAELRPYQAEGASWLLFLRELGLGGCLADDMGLGKTIQFIAYLLQVKGGRGERKGLARAGKRKREEGELVSGPALLICPTSVLGNWQKELERFAPSLHVHLHYGPQRAKGEAFPVSLAGVDVVLTTYTIAQLDEEELAGVSWQALCLDEAQNIKNAYTKQAQAIRRLTADQRIALTGTPIENRLTELWSIFDFINPGYFGSLRRFTQAYVGPIERGGEGAAELSARVQRLIRPFLLRRVKKDPAIQLDLPDKYEGKAFVKLTAEQAALYEQVTQSMMEKIEGLTGFEKKGLILATLTKLKQVCDHPALLLKETTLEAAEGVRKVGRGRAAAGDAAAWMRRSAKLERLAEMVDELRSEGGSCLLFTQFVEMGRLLQASLAQRLGEPVQFLHGGLGKAERDALVARFQDEALPAEERCHVFVLSLKAGGTGLNLTAANHVFHFDRWWNPAVENQATDRAFRIGQTRDVQVHKFVTLGTLEERIDEMIERKQGLSDQIVGSGENWITELSTGELRELFALRREWIEG